jgi:hypothetical protein
MFNRDIIEHVCFQQKVPLDICFENRDDLYKCDFCNATKLKVLLQMHSSLDEHLYEINYKYVLSRAKNSGRQCHFKIWLDCHK